MPRSFLIRVVMIASALITIGVGVWIYTDTDKVLGAILVLFGVLDLITMRFVLRMIERNSAAAKESAPGAGEDPSVNPYARED